MQVARSRHTLNICFLDWNERCEHVSPLSENIALLEAEKIAREREPGDGTRQRRVVEQMEAVLAKPAT